MSDVQVSQAEKLFKDLLGNMASYGEWGLRSYREAAMRTIEEALATRPAPVGEPVAWMYAHPKFGCYTDIKRRFTHPGWTETPLYTRPALDVDGLVEKGARACKNCGFLPDSTD